MRLPIIVAFGALPFTLHGQAPARQSPLLVIDSISSPESVAIGPEGAWYISSFGEFDVKGDGAVYRVQPEQGTREIYARGLDDPCGVIFAGGWLWVADRQGVYRVTQGKIDLVYPAKSFPRPLHFLNDLAAGPGGILYVSDTGDSTSAGRGAVFVLAPGKRPVVLAGSDTVHAQSSANGLLPGGGDTLFVVGYRTGVLSLTDGHGAWKEIASGLGSPDGIDRVGRENFYVSDNVGGDLYLVSQSAGRGPVKVASGLKAPADLLVDRKRGWLVVPENAGNRVSAYRIDTAAR